MKSTTATAETVTGRWSRRMDRWHDEQGPFHRQRDDGSPACGASFLYMAGPHRDQPARAQCCKRCLKGYDAEQSAS